MALPTLLHLMARSSLYGQATAPCSGNIRWMPLAFVIPLYSRMESFTSLSDGSLEALRPGDGSILWHYTSKATILWYPRVVDGLMYVRHINGTMDVLQSSTGKFLWRYPATS